MAKKSTEDSKWQCYYAATRGRPPRPTLLRALDSFDRQPVAGRVALDLGCGNGRDTVELLRRGWRVVAIDRTADAVADLDRSLDLWQRQRLDLRVGDMCRLPLPPVTLVNASFSLPFIERPAFVDLWHRIFVALRPGGRFAGQLLGPSDSWVRGGRRHGFDRLELLYACRRYEIERIEEERTHAVTPAGEAKYWHLWHLNLRKSRAVTRPSSRS